MRDRDFIGEILALVPDGEKLPKGMVEILRQMNDQLENEMKTTDAMSSLYMNNNKITAGLQAQVESIQIQLADYKKREHELYKREFEANRSIGLVEKAEAVAESYKHCFNKAFDSIKINIGKEQANEQT